MRIAFVAGETSGDQLGAGLIKQLQIDYPDAVFYGIGGPLMQAAGFHSLYNMEDISMIGLEGVFTKLPKIIKIRSNLYNKFINDKPDLFIGIDVPDFNLGLEKKLTLGGLICIHYVSPTIWAWRGNRIKTIKKAIAHMLVLFPFEADIYERHHVPATFVGHPIADEVDAVENQDICRDKLNLGKSDQIIALLPGSRTSEIHRHTDLFLESALLMSQANNELKFIISAVNEQAQEYIHDCIANYPSLNIKIITGGVRQVISASDLVLAASGTVTLETALMGKPLVVAYRVSKLSELMVRFFSKVKFYAMPNFLLDKPLIPEFIQQQATPENIVKAMTDYLYNTKLRDEIIIKFKILKLKLKVNSNKISAEVVKTLLESNRE